MIKIQKPHLRPEEPLAKITLPDVTSGHGSRAAINAAFAAVETALENTLSRDGTSPNQMTASLDMNSNRILNLPSASTAGEPVTKAQLDAATSAGSLALAGVSRSAVTPTAGQTVFTTPTYVQGTNNLFVLVNGVFQNGSYSETSTTSVTFSSGLGTDDEVLFIVFTLT